MKSQQFIFKCSVEGFVDPDRNDKVYHVTADTDKSPDGGYSKRAAIGQHTVLPAGQALYKVPQSLDAA